MQTKSIKATTFYRLQKLGSGSEMDESCFISVNIIHKVEIKFVISVKTRSPKLKVAQKSMIE